MTFEELFRDEATHRRALELMLVAHLALDRRCLDGREKPEVSPQCQRLVRLMRTMPTSFPFEVDCVLAYAEFQYSEPTGAEPPFDHLPAPLPRARGEEITDYVGAAAALTPADLSLLSREAVLSCLGATVIPIDDTPYIETPADTADIITPPWKRRYKRKDAA